VKQVITPDDFLVRYGSNRGSIYGTSSNSRMAAFLRPRNKLRSLDNLYLAGGSTHPGGGIPLVIQSAFNVRKLVQGAG
jgi:phytoene dehydrogenase-like protein